MQYLVNTLTTITTKVMPIVKNGYGSARVPAVGTRIIDYGAYPTPQLLPHDQMALLKVDSRG